MINPIREFRNIAVQIARMFRVKRSEALPALIALMVYMALNAVMIMHYAEKFMRPTRGVWSLFIKNFSISGFDPITYVVISRWSPDYNIFRHPLLAFFVWPLSVIDKWLVEATGVNFVQYMVAAILLFLVFYSFIFVIRICRDIIGVKNADAIMLSSLLFSFAYVMLSFIAPDHFGPSMFMLLMALYVCGVKLRDGKRLSGWQTMLMFLFTAGLTLSNGIKVFIDALFVDGRRFFRPRYLLFAVLIPSAVIWSFARWEYKYYKYPEAMKRNAEKKKKADEKREKDFVMFRDTTSLTDTAEVRVAFDSLMAKCDREKKLAAEKNPHYAHRGKPIANGEFSSWTDISTPRWDSMVENLFGESIQLHPDYLLGDTLRGRPVLVYYNNWLNYTVELVLVVLFAIGVWMGRRSKFLWMVMCGFGFDMFIHVVLGFGLNEVYIMGAHWLFVMPVAMAYILKNVEGRKLLAVRILLTLLTLYLLAWNATLFVGYLI